MSDTLLRTKLFIPPQRPTFVSRAHLHDRLNQGVDFGHKLTLIAAPAGFGKTTLVTSWLHAAQQSAATASRSACWLSLDENDTDPRTFLTYFIAALQQLPGTAAPIGTTALGLLQSPQLPPIASVFTSLINELADLAAANGAMSIVLDDYHLLDAPDIDKGLAFLLDHLPPGVNLIILTREDPRLPLARYRARGQMTELRAADLRFTPQETADFLNQMMGLNLDATAINALESRTEGWIAGLQMAALALQGNLARTQHTAADPTETADFITAFTGSHRFVMDYLIEEVLRQQPEPVRHFLLQTAILDELNGPLCDQVTGQTGSQTMLTRLERDNLFLIPLDQQRQWYRYHHLFADVLRARLQSGHLALVPQLHRQASEWYWAHERPVAAIRHALAAADFPYAAGLIEQAWPEMDGRFQSAIWLEWAHALPRDLIGARPVLSTALAWAFLNQGDMAAAAQWLQTAEQWLDEGPEQPASDRIISDTAQFQTLPASIATAHAYMAAAVGDAEQTIRYAQQALDLLPDTAMTKRGPAASLLGLTYWRMGKLEAAYQALAAAMTGFRQAGSIAFAISGTYGLADIRVGQGRWRAAQQIYEEAFHYLQEQGNPPIRGRAELHLGLALLARERGDRETAGQQMARAATLGETVALENWPPRWRIARALFQIDAGELTDALTLLDEAQRLSFPSPVPDLRPIPALRTRIWLRQGRLAEAWAWAEAEGITTTDPLSYQREFDHLTLVQLLIAHHQQDQRPDLLDQAHALLARLQPAAAADDRRGSLIAIYLWQAVVATLQKEHSTALNTFVAAMTLAEPEGVVQPFVEVGPALIPLLQQAIAQGHSVPYARHLLAALPAENGRSAAATDPVPPPTALVDPLSDREMDVLRLLPTSLTGPEIASQLVISLNTMRTHTKNIYSKLRVHNRRAAVHKAQELGLLS